MYINPKMEKMIAEGELDPKRLAIFLAIFIPVLIGVIIFASIETKKLDARELNTNQPSSSSEVHLDVGNHEPKPETTQEPIRFLYNTRNAAGDLVIKVSDGDERFEIIIARDDLQNR